MLSIPYSHPSWIEINLSQFKKNISTIKKYIGNSKLCFPVKANAYGHGLIPLSKAAENYGVDYLAVSCLQEGILLRQSGISIPILVLGAIHENQITDLIHNSLEFTVGSKYKANHVSQVAQLLKKTCKIHIEVETGMQRTGLRLESAEKLIDELMNDQYLQITGIYSHMATSDVEKHPFAQEQIESFKTFIDHVRKKTNLQFLAHLANSGGVCYWPNSFFDMVRPGLLALGFFNKKKPVELDGIAPFFSLKAKVSYFKVVKENSGVSYNHTYKTKSETRILTIPVGYGDGYRRSLSNKGYVLINGKRYKISGTVCMDQFMVDIGQDEAYVNDEVVLIGKQDSEEISVHEISQWCDTIPYEILCSFNERIPRIYF